MTHGTYRGVYCSLIEDPDYQALSAHARLVLLTARLCVQAGPAAIFRYYYAVLAQQTGLTEKQVLSSLDELEAGGWCQRDEAVLWIRNGLRHDPSMRMSDEKHRKSVIRAISALPHREVVLRFCQYYGLPSPFAVPSEPLSRVIEGPSKGKGESGNAGPSEKESETEKEKEYRTPPTPPGGPREWIDLLNRLTGRRFEYTDKYLGLIRVHVKRGKRLADAGAVIRDRMSKWKDDPEKAEWLRPETLFGSKFDTYLALTQKPASRDLRQPLDTAKSWRNGHEAGRPAPESTPYEPDALPASPGGSKLAQTEAPDDRAR